jgi:hypothetical protein
MIDLPLFDNTPSPAFVPPSPAQTREEAMKAAFAHADERFRTEYRAFILRFAERNETFIAEECCHSYRSDPRNPLPRDWRASGGIFQSLLKQGLLEQVGYGRSVKRCVPMPLFAKGDKC